MSRTPSMSHDFFTYGNDGIGLHHASERRAAEQDHYRIAASLAQPRRAPALRQRLGNWLIALGQDIRGECAPTAHPSGAIG